MAARKKTKDRVLKASTQAKHLDLAIGVLFQEGIFTLEQRSRAKKILITAELPALKPKLLANLRRFKTPDGKKLFETLQVSLIRNHKWAEEYKKNLKPFPFVFGSLKDRKHPQRALLWIDPRSHAKISANSLQLEAGLAFGTGTHPTTQLCAQLLAERLTRSPAKKVLDLGCGTGLLAMLAAKLGSKTVWAIDNDPVAIEVAQENLTKNKIQNIRLAEDLKKSPRSFEIIVANILLNTLLELKPLILTRLGPKATLIVSGLLYKDCKELIQSYKSAGLKFIARRNQKGWSALIFENS